MQESLQLNGREFIIGLTGYHESGYVKSLTIKTNLWKYGPFGRDNSRDSSGSFNLKFGPGNRFGGFHGCFSSDAQLTSIGVYIKPTHS